MMFKKKKQMSYQILRNFLFGSLTATVKASLLDTKIEPYRLVPSVLSPLSVDFMKVAFLFM